MFVRFRMASPKFSAPISNYNPPEELVAIVDQNNELIGAAPRRQMRQENLIHRSTYTFVLNSANQLYVQKRVDFKDIFPGYYDPAPGGVVLAEETSNLESAQRELEEEMGISGTDLEHQFNMFYEDTRIRVWMSVYLTHYSGEVSLQPEEVASLEMLTPSEIVQMQTQGFKFVPDSMQAFQKLIELGKLKV